MGKANKPKIEHWHVIALLLAVYDVIAVNMAYFLALWLRFDCAISRIGTPYLDAFLRFVPIYTVFSIAVFLILRLYNSLWRFASYRELIRVITASLITAVFHIIFITILFRRMPISYYFFGALIQFVLVLGIRFSYRFILLLRQNQVKDEAMKRVMLIGAGAAGQMILRDLHHAEIRRDKVVCIIDDNPNKWHRDIDGVPVVGGRDDILSAVQNCRLPHCHQPIPPCIADTSGVALPSSRSPTCCRQRTHASLPVCSPAQHTRTM